MTVAAFSPARPWIAHDEEQLRALALEGKTAAAIAKRLGRTEEAIRNRAHKLEISFGRKELGLKAKAKAKVTRAKRRT